MGELVNYFLILPSNAGWNANMSIHRFAKYEVEIPFWMFWYPILPYNWIGSSPLVYEKKKSSFKEVAFSGVRRNANRAAPLISKFVWHNPNPAMWGIQVLPNGWWLDKPLSLNCSGSYTFLFWFSWLSLKCIFYFTPQKMQP